MGTDNVNPMANIYKEFTTILHTMTIKYNYLAEKYETFETKKAADGYIMAMTKTDTFLTYRDYTTEEFNKVGITDKNIIAKYKDNIRLVPKRYWDDLLELRRARTIKLFEEKNNYYRMLNGYPSVETKPDKYHYITKNIENSYGISSEIPVHELQDYYNEQEPGEGDRVINILTGIGFIDKLRESFPDEEYLKYIGYNRIDLIKAREAKNFEILQLPSNKITYTVYDAFINLYEQCRDYFVTTIYNSEFRQFMNFYDNFIAMCIMIMTTQQLIMKHISFIVTRNFFDITAVRMLYEAYNIPYDLYIDEETQTSIAQNLNMLIQNKSTNKVIYDVADLLGFTNLTAYKYYLAKERKFDIYGVPIVKYTEKFNTDTGETEVIPDYKAMYDLYFQKEELNEDDFIKTFNSKVNKVKYEDITVYDPYWWEDENLFKRKWEIEYNFVETKYLSLGISYKMTDIMFENVLLLKLLMQQKDQMKDVAITIPKIINGLKVPLFDLVILLICLVAKKHSITGEIISIPTQVVHVLDYLQNVDSGSEYTVNSFAFDFDYLKSDQGIEDVKMLKKILGEEDAALLDKYLSVLSIDSKATNEDKIKAFNDMYYNIRHLSDFIAYKMTDAADIREYDALKKFYKAAFYSREMKEIFTVVGEQTSFRRTAKNYFEFLYYYNPILYSTIFTVNFEKSYEKYLEEHTNETMTFEEFKAKVEYGEIDVKFDTLKEDETTGNTRLSEKTLYYYINHIISRFKTIIKNLNFLYLINDNSTPLEELLVRMIKFVKSFTVEMIGLDTIYICNMKQENMVRMIDDVDYINKLIAMRQNLKLSYSDVVHLISTHMNVNDSMKLEDIIRYNVLLRLGWYNENDINIYDLIKETTKSLEMKDDISNLFDSIPKYDSNLIVKENNGLRDKVERVWYSED